MYLSVIFILTIIMIYNAYMRNSKVQFYRKDIYMINNMYKNI